MKIEIHYYGMIAEKLGKNIEFLEGEEVDTSLPFRKWLISKYPELSEMTFQCAFDGAIQEIIPHNNIKQIAILPPFAGG